MIDVRSVARALLCASLVIGCASVASPTATVSPTNPPTPASNATTPPGSTTTTPTLSDAEQALDSGTYRLSPAALGTTFPPILFTVPDGWSNSGRFVYIQRSDQFVVSVGFWDVAQVYGHPCRWEGTLFDPGPTVEDLAEALAGRPLRDATQPVDVTLDGHAGKYLEWSVPADIEQDAEGNFVDCDLADDGVRAFESWTGWGGGDRYQQGPSQVDRLWILDVDGARLVIDAMDMPSATDEERAQLLDVMESIRFER